MVIKAAKASDVNKAFLITKTIFLTAWTIINSKTANADKE